MLVLGMVRDDRVNIRLPDGREVGVILTRICQRESSTSIKLAFDAPPDVLIFREAIRDHFPPPAKP